MSAPIEITDGKPFRFGGDYVFGEPFEYRLSDDGSVTYRQKPVDPTEEKSWTALLVNDPGDDQDYIEVEANTIQEAADKARAQFRNSGWAEVTIYGDGCALVVPLDDDAEARWI